MENLPPPPPPGLVLDSRRGEGRDLFSEGLDAADTTSAICEKCRGSLARDIIGPSNADLLLLWKKRNILFRLE